MRAIWTGAISFGLVNIPIRLYSATEERGLQFHYLHEKDHSPVRYAKICRAEEKEIPFEQIVKGYEYQKGEYVILTSDDFVRADIKKTRTIDIMDFADAADVNMIYFEKSYFLEPDRGAAKPYALLREALRKSGRLGIAKFVLRNKENLAALQPYGDVLLMTQMRFHDEVRQTKDLQIPSDDLVKKSELEMALTLVDQLTGKFNPKAYHDTYTRALEQVIQEKLEGKVPKLRPKPAEPAKVKDLMSLLKASLNKERKSTKKAA